MLWNVHSMRVVRIAGSKLHGNRSRDDDDDIVRYALKAIL